MTLSSTVIAKPSEEHIWLEGNWIHKTQAPLDYTPPVSSVPSYDPAWSAFLTPYTWVLKDDEDFSVSLEQINTNTYPGDQLAEPVTAVAICGTAALVSRDGAFALPMQGEMVLQHHAVEMMNRLFCALLIGGICTESVAHNDVLVGCLGEDKRLFLYVATQQGRFRHMWASIQERCTLLHPRIIRVSQLQEGLSYGLGVLDRVQNLSPYFLLHGYTALQHQNLSDALSSLWISVEQLTSCLLTKASQVVKPNTPIVAKHKLLLQLGAISDDCYARLDTARSSRNDLLHEGKSPHVDTVIGVWPALCEMLSAASELPLDRLANIGNWNHQPASRVGKTNFDGWGALANSLA